MIGYKYVKFRRWTALNNPDMIAREYEALLKYHKTRSETGYKPITVRLHGSLHQRIVDAVKHKISLNHFVNQDLEISMNYDELRTVLTNMQAQEHELAYHYDMHKRIQLESDRFKRNYNGDSYRFR